MHNDKKTLFLIDAYSLIYRAYYALGPLSTSTGFPTGAIYGFTNMLLKILKKRAPDLLVVCFDSRTPTFRHTEFSNYKAHRERMPRDLRVQIEVIKEIIEAFGIQSVSVEGYEADDIVATLTKRAERDETIGEIYLVTSDKDALQLVSKKTKVLTSKRGLKDEVVLDESAIKERYGVGPEKIVDFLSLTGDASDNIPGVEGIGEKTAAKLILDFGSLEALYEKSPEIKKKALRESIERGRENAFLSKSLIRLDVNVPIDLEISKVGIGEFDRTRLFEIFSRLEFRSFMKELGLTKVKEKTSYKVILTQDELKDLVDRISRSGQISIWAEITKVESEEPKLTAFVIGISQAEAFLIPTYKKDEYLKGEVVLGVLKPILEDPKIKKIGHDLKKEVLFLKRQGIDLEGISFDTMLASYSINPTQKHTLEDLCLRYLDKHWITLSDVLKERKTLEGVTTEDMIKALSPIPGSILSLKNTLEPLLEAEGVSDMFKDIEMPLVKVLAQMEFFGMKIDTEYINQMSDELEGDLERLQREIWDIAGKEFNINSSKQLQYVLFEKLKLPTIKRIKTGYSTDEAVLQKLVRYHPLPKKLLTFRELSKLKTTYVDALPRLVNKNTGRIHTSFNQAKTATGRLSSSNPNLQNIPIRSSFGSKIRKGFVADPGYVLVSSDYSQIELRILAHISGDEALIQSFKDEEDIHARTAAEIFQVRIDQVTEDLRRVAKTINFGIAYGMSSFGLSEELGIPQKEADEYIRRYFARYQGVKRYIETTKAFALENGFVTTLWGRKRFLPEIYSKNKNVREFTERMAINTPIQGSAADLIKLAMIRIHNRVLETSIDLKMLLQVHDELIFEVPPDAVSDAERLIRDGMEGAAALSVPIKVNIKIGENWKELE